MRIQLRPLEKAQGREIWRRLRGLVLALAVLLGIACSSLKGSGTSPPGLIPPPPEPGSQSLPMPVRTLGNSRFRLLGLRVGVAGSEVEVLLDSGSAGLRILSSAAGRFGLERTGIPSTVTFADGTQFLGVLARAPFSLGGIQSREPVTIQLIDQITCVEPPVASCSDYLFGPGRPFAGILGTSWTSAALIATCLAPSLACRAIFARGTSSKPAALSLLRAFSPSA
jgi:hypothetical protein